MATTFSTLPDLLRRLPATLTSCRMEDADDRADTIRLLRRMTRTERELIYLRYACLMSERAVSDAMGISRRRYRYHEQRALMVVRDGI